MPHLRPALRPGGYVFEAHAVAGLLAVFVVALELLETPDEHRRGTRVSHIGIEHCVIQVRLRPFQPKILPDKRRPRFVGCVDLFDCLVLSCTARDQSADLMIARRIEKHTEDILATAQEKLRTSADNH